MPKLILWYLGKIAFMRGHCVSYEVDDQYANCVVDFRPHVAMYKLDLFINGAHMQNN